MLQLRSEISCKINEIKTVTQRQTLTSRQDICDENFLERYFLEDKRFMCDPALLTCEALAFALSFEAELLKIWLTVFIFSPLNFLQFEMSQSILVLCN